MKAILEILKLEAFDVVTASTTGGNVGENETPDGESQCAPEIDIPV